MVAAPDLHASCVEFLDPPQGKGQLLEAIIHACDAAAALEG
jgi:hypothetical protein